MAWWTTQLVFAGDALIAEGVDPLAPLLVDRAVEVEGAVPPAGAPRYTQVLVSGYALYGELRGYYALGVGHWVLDRAAPRAYTTEASQRHAEPVASLSPAQRAVVRECLVRISPEAWEASHHLFRKELDNDLDVES